MALQILVQGTVSKPLVIKLWLGTEQYKVIKPFQSLGVLRSIAASIIMKWKNSGVHRTLPRVCRPAQNGIDQEGDQDPVTLT